MTVAIAAPFIPKSRPRTSTASSMVLTTAPVILHIMVILGLPSARIICPPPVVSIRNGKPKAVYFTYSLAYGMTASVAPKRFSSGVRNTSVITDSITPLVNSREREFPAKYGALFLSPIPIVRLKQDAPPIPRSSASAIQPVVNGKAIEVAVFPRVPTAFPINS